MASINNGMRRVIKVGTSLLRGTAERPTPAVIADLAGSLAKQQAKGDVLAVARVAAIQAAKRTWELIPLCHPIALTGLDVAIAPGDGGGRLRIEVTARTNGSTGVEMEALTAVQVGLLTIYDMVKALDPAMSMGPVRLLRKSGGRNGDWQSDG